MKTALIILTLLSTPQDQVKWKYDMLERVALRWHAEKIEASYHKPPIITSCKEK